MELTIDVINQIVFLAFKVTVAVLPVVILLDRSRNTSAANLHTLLLIAFVGLLAIPLVYFLLPNIPIKLLTATVFTTLSGTQLPHSGLQWAIALVLMVYTAGLWVTLCNQLLGLIRLQQLSLHASPINTGAIKIALGDLKQSLGITREIQLVQHATINIPMTWGLTSAYIGLPKDHRQWPPGRLNRVLLHELAHIKRNDGLVNIILGLVVAALWWMPTLKLLKAKIHWYRELACDDMVLARGVARADYAQDLLDFTLQRGAPMAGAVALIDVSQNFDRINTVLDNARVNVASKAQWPIFALVIVTVFGFIGSLKLEPMTASPVNRFVVLLPTHQFDAGAEPDAASGPPPEPIVLPAPPIKVQPALTLGVGSLLGLSGISTPFAKKPIASKPSIDVTVDPPFLSLSYSSPLLPIQQVKPVYPKKALKRGYEGRVQARFDVLRNGTTDNIRIVTADVNPLILASVKAAISQYRYQARWQNGKPTITKNLTEVFQFQIKEDAN